MHDTYMKFRAYDGWPSFATMAGLAYLGSRKGAFRIDLAMFVRHLATVFGHTPGTKRYPTLAFF